jgi:hypothetical protein
MERLIEKHPAFYPGYDHYYAGRYRMYYGDHLRERRERVKAREQWQKALDHFMAIKTKYPDHSYNKVDPDVGYSTADRWIRNCKDEDRLGR